MSTTIILIKILDSVDEPGLERPGQDGDPRLVTLARQLTLHLGPQLVLVHQAREEEEQLSLADQTLNSITKAVI